jgi:hypothetical protein
MQCGVRGSWTLFFFFPLQPRLSKGIPKQEERYKKLTHFIVFMSSPCNTGPLCAAIVFPFKKVEEEREVGGSEIGELGKKSNEDFLMS